MPKTKAKKAPSKRKPNAAFMRPVQPDEKLSAIVGSKPLPRSEMTKKLWDYIKKNGLQDKKKRTQINADDAMRAVFNGKSQVSMFEMTKLVSGHSEDNRLTTRSAATAGSEGNFFSPAGSCTARGRFLFPRGTARCAPLLAGTPSIGEWFPVKTFRVLFLTAAAALCLSAPRGRRQPG